MSNTYYWISLSLCFILSPPIHSFCVIQFHRDGLYNETCSLKWKKTERVEEHDGDGDQQNRRIKQSWKERIRETSNVVKYDDVIHSSGVVESLILKNLHPLIFFLFGDIDSPLTTTIYLQYEAFLLHCYCNVTVKDSVTVTSGPNMEPSYCGMPFITVQ